MLLFLKFCILIASVVLGYLGGLLFTEEFPLNKWRIFQFKAFECRPCLSFHISWVTSTAVALLLGDWIMVAVGIFFALMLYWGIIVDIKEKTESIYKEDKKWQDQRNI